METDYYCVVSRGNGSHVLLRRAGAGWELPSVRFDGSWWFATAVPYLAALVTQELGVPVTVLREVQEVPTRVIEIEATDAVQTEGTELRWVDAEEAGRLPLTNPQHQEVVAAWGADRGAAMPGRAPWELAGWRATAEAWIAEQLERLNLVSMERPEVVKAAWSWSCILRVPTTEGDLYFKAVRERPPFEGVVIDTLAERWPDAVPELVASDPGRRWLMMKDYGTRTLVDEGMAWWEGAVRGFARIQIETGGEVERWLGVGCPDRRVERLSQLVRTVCADEPALRPSFGSRAPWFVHARDAVELSDDEIERLAELPPRVAALCERLSGFALPAALVPLDFRHGNMAVGASGCRYYDVGESVVAHPFFSLARFLDYLLPQHDEEVVGPSGVALEVRHSHAAWRRVVSNAYLRQWTDFAPLERLREALALVQRLQQVFLWVRWYEDLPYLEAGSAWGALQTSLIPRFARELLEDPSWEWDDSRGDPGSTRSTR